MFRNQSTGKKQYIVPWSVPRQRLRNPLASDISVCIIALTKYGRFPLNNCAYVIINLYALASYVLSTPLY
jgi:hypothetical protein